jgi:hypothetical protein
MNSSTPRWELAVSLFIIGVCLVVLWETRDIPPGVFEPLGSAPVPQATATVILLLSAVVAAAAVRRMRTEARVSFESREGYKPRPVDAIVVALLAIVYVFALQERVMDFAPLTAIFLFAAIGFLSRFAVRSLAWGAAVAAVTGWGVQYVFTRVFVVDLPGL